MKTSLLVAAAVSTLGLGGTAAASPSAQADALRDPSIAMALSLGGTLASIGTLGAAIAFHDERNSELLYLTGFVGLVVMPTAGHYYGAGDILTVGSGLRLGGLAMVVVAGANGALSLGEGAEQNDAMGALAAVGAGVFTVGVIYDVATARSATHEANAERRMMITPTVVSTDRGTNAGLALTGSF